jgi:hypothetical protein
MAFSGGHFPAQMKQAGYDMITTARQSRNQNKSSRQRHRDLIHFSFSAHSHCSDEKAAIDEI